jgi:hypothetical protein
MHPLRIEHPEAKCPRHPNKEYRRLVEAAWAAGWWCERRRKYILLPATGLEIATGEGRDDAAATDHPKCEGGFPQGGSGGVASAPMSAREEMEVTAEFEMNIELELQEPEPVPEDVLDAHADEAADAIERNAADLALGHTVSFDVTQSRVLLRFDLLGDTDAEIYEKLAEVIRVILRETGLPLRVAQVEIKPITQEDWDDLTRFLEQGRSAA